MKNWRFIPYQQFDGATNMAIDEALLESHLSGSAPPTVRLYGWKPAAVSIGYAQTLSVEVIERIHLAGFDLVRRPTGGRAVLHADELTYSFVGTSRQAKNSLTGDGFLPPSIISAYKEICKGLIYALEELGVRTSLGASDSSYRQLQDCFLATTTADLQHDGKKLVGSAQCRRGRGVLQHGSILLNQNQDAMEFLLTGRGDASASTSTRHKNLFDAASREFSIEELSAALRSGFERAFACILAVGELHANELALANELREKYELTSESGRSTIAVTELNT